MDLKKLARSRGTTLKKVAEQCEVPASTLYAIACGATNFDNVGIGLFIKIANAMGMTAEELYTGEITEKVIEEREPELSINEQKVVECYRRCDEQGRAEIEEYAEYQTFRHPLNQGNSVKKAM